MVHETAVVLKRGAISNHTQCRLRSLEALGLRGRGVFLGLILLLLILLMLLTLLLLILLTSPNACSITEVGAT